MMNTTTTILETTTESTPALAAPAPNAWVRQATVLESSSDGACVVAVDTLGAPRVSAVMAVGAPVGPGDRVVVTGEGFGPGYVIGVLGARARVTRESGFTVEVSERDGEEHVDVCDPAGRLVVSVDPRGRTTVAAAQGDLSLTAVGDVEIAAGGAVRVTGQREVSLSTPDGASLSLTGSLTRLASQALSVAADRADLGVRDLALAGDRVRATIADATLTAKRLESTVSNVFARCVNAFRDVEELDQLRAGRARTLVREGLFVRSGHASIEAEADVKIDGGQVHIG